MRDGKERARNPGVHSLLTARWGGPSHSGGLRGMAVGLGVVQTHTVRSTDAQQ